MLVDVHELQGMHWRGWVNLFGSMWVTECERHRLYVGLGKGWKPDEHAQVDWAFVLTRNGHHGPCFQFPEGEGESVAYVVKAFEQWRRGLVIMMQTTEALMRSPLVELDIKEFIVDMDGLVEGPVPFKNIEGWRGLTEPHRGNFLPGGQPSGPVLVDERGEEDEGE